MGIFKFDNIQVDSEKHDELLDKLMDAHIRGEEVYYEQYKFNGKVKYPYSDFTYEVDELRCKGYIKP